MLVHPNLERSLGFQLRLLEVEAEAQARKALEPFDISPARVAALMVIDANPGCTQTALGEALTVNRASAMKLVNFLEGRGLVRRTPSPDPRANALLLTDEGCSALKAMTIALKAADDQAMSVLTAKEASIFLACVGKLRDSFAAEGENNP